MPSLFYLGNGEILDTAQGEIAGITRGSSIRGACAFVETLGLTRLLLNWTKRKDDGEEKKKQRKRGIKEDTKVEELLKKTS